MRKGYFNSTSKNVLLVCILLLTGCNRNMINLTPDVLREYGLDQVTLPNVQFFYKVITVRADSTVTHDEPTIFRRIDSHGMLVSETQSPAVQSRLGKNDIIIIKNGTPCRIVEVLENGRTLRADFGELKMNFELSYRSGYNFQLVSDTVEYQNKRYLRSQVPLVQSVGILSVNRKSLQILNDSEIRIPGRIIDREKTN